MKKIKSSEAIMAFLMWLIRVNIVLAALYTLIEGNWELFFVSVLALILSFLPSLIEGRYRLELPIEFEIAIVTFIYLSIFLGEYGDAYEKFFWWDALLHAASGVFFAFASLIYMYALLKNNKLKASPFIISVIVFSVSMGVGAVWEIFEFAMDSIFGLNMQKNGLSDTMWDLIVNAIGALGVCYAGYRLLVSKNEKGYIQRGIDRFFDSNPHLKGKKKL